MASRRGRGHSGHRLDLLKWGVAGRTIELVRLLTKQGDQSKPESPEYYQAISSDDGASAIKAADRCANLEDALTSVQGNHSLKRWRKYVERARTDVLPIYASLPVRRNEIEVRLAAIDAALLEYAA